VQCKIFYKINQLIFFIPLFSAAIINVASAKSIGGKNFFASTAALDIFVNSIIPYLPIGNFFAGITFLLASTLFMMYVEL